MVIERYSHVMHIVSNVRGKLRRAETAYDVLPGLLPGGHGLGRPKIRAMQIIDELEPTRRGPYAGAVGYFGFSRQHGHLHHHPHARDQGQGAPTSRRAAAWWPTATRPPNTRRR